MLRVRTYSIFQFAFEYFLKHFSRQIINNKCILLCTLVINYGDFFDFFCLSLERRETELKTAGELLTSRCKWSFLDFDYVEPILSHLIK